MTTVLEGRQPRRGTAAAWTSADPTLAEGELGYETDTGKAKRGDGSTAWTSLGYVDGNLDPSLIPNTPSGNLEATDVQGALDELQTDVDTRQATSEKGAANGYAGLDADGTVPAAQLPDLSISETFTVADEAAMLALDAQVGDLAIRQDEGDARYILAGPDATVAANWIGLAHPTDAVQSVAGKTGTVTLESADLTDRDNVTVQDGTLSVDDLVVVKSLSPLVVEGIGRDTYAPAGYGVVVDVQRAAAQTIANATPTAITFDTENHDPNGYWAAGSPTRVTIPASGGGKRHRFYASVGLNTTSASGRRQIKLLKNGTGNVGLTEVEPPSAGPQRYSFVVDETPSAGDYYELSVYQSIGSDVDTGASAQQKTQLIVELVEEL